MRGLLNLLGIVLVALFVVLRRSFTDFIEHPMHRGDRRKRWLRATLMLTMATAAAFVGMGLWRLATTGYAPVALLLAAFVGLLLDALRRRVRVSRSSGRGPRD